MPYLQICVGLTIKRKIWKISTMQNLQTNNWKQVVNSLEGNCMDINSKSWNIDVEYL